MTSLIDPTPDATPDAAPRPALEADYFDGVRARAHPVRITVLPDGLHIQGEGIARRVALHDVQWPERTRHGPRVAHFKDGGAVQAPDPMAWDAWCQTSGRSDSMVVRLQQSWRGVLAAIVLLIGLVFALQRWGIPVASRALLTAIPLSADQSLGQASLAAVDAHIMQPSTLPVVEQEHIRDALTRACATLPAGTLPAWQLVFRHSLIGPNAFALPDGTLVLTDELVNLVDHDQDVITAVLAHEIGHVRHRDGMRLLIQSALLAGVGSVFFGDFSTLLAGVPVLLGQAGYSRAAEHEADAQAMQIIRAAGISPLVMVKLFQRLQMQRQLHGPVKKGPGEEPAADQNSWLGIAFASHPTDADRVRYFREAAQQNPR